MPYEGIKPDFAPSVEELRARIPGWGADAAPQHRRTWQEIDDADDHGAPWSFPERQPGDGARERSIEHEMLPPVYGTAQPLHGLSGRIRRIAYDRFSETKNTRWLILVLGDRVESIGAHLRSLASRRPDEPITQSGVLAELSHRPIASRIGRGRIDLRHTWMDPIIVVGPWLVGILVATRSLRKLLRR